MTWKTPESMPAFNRTVRALRQARGCTHRQISEALGLKGMSYQNAEHKPFKAMSLARVHRLAAFYGLDPAARSQLVAEWEALPASAYAEKNQDRWTRRRQVRSKAKHHDALQIALLEVLSVCLDLAAAHPEHELCTCTAEDPFAGTTERTCEICQALSVLGYPGKFNGFEPVTAFLANLQEGLAPEQND